MPAAGTDSSSADGPSSGGPHADTHPADERGAGLRVEVLPVVFQVRTPADADAAHPVLSVLLSEAPAGRWSLPRDVAHLEQLSVFSDPDRVPGIRTIASSYLGLVPSDASSGLPGGAGWFAVDALPEVVFDHAAIIETARHRLAAKLSYTNIAFALAPKRFPMSELSEIYCAALGYPVDTTNLLRILSRRAVVVSTGTVGKTGRAGGRPPALYAFADNGLRVTDEFATLRPPM